MINPSQRSRGPRQRLEVVLNDVPYTGRNAKNVFIEVLRTIGLQEVAGSGIFYGGHAVVGKEKPARTDLYELIDGYYVRVNSSTFVKAGLLEQIARCLQLSLKARSVSLEEELLA